MRTLPKHVDDIVSDDRTIDNDAVRFTKAEINLSDSTCKIIKIFNFFNINVNENDNRFLNLADRCRNDVAVLDKFNGDGLSIFSFRKHAFANKVFILILVYIYQQQISLIS